MTIYSIIPDEIIFAGAEDQQYAYLDMRINGMDLQVEMMNAHQAKIIRLFSVNANDYLNADFAPGKIIEFQPVTMK
jgi:hypothetical protein